MGTELDKGDAGQVEGRPQAGAVMPVRRIGSGIGVLDLLALEDITTAGAWMPEIGFVIASIPALIVLGYYTFRRGSMAGRTEAKENAPEEQGPEPS